MPIKIQLANTPALCDAVLKVRHDVFSGEEEDLSFREDRRILDRFDAYPTTHNFVAMDGQTAVGAMRLTFDSDVGLPADQYFDFRSIAPTNGRLAHAGMFCVRRAYRKTGVSIGLMCMTSYLWAANGATHVLAPINPVIREFLEEFAFEAVGETFREPHTGSLMTPLLLDVKNIEPHYIRDRFIPFARQQKMLHDIGHYQRLLYREGETIMSAGDMDIGAIFVVDGKAEIRPPGGRQTVRTVGPGDVFEGPIVAAAESRSAKVVAATDLQLMIFPKVVSVQ